MATYSDKPSALLIYHRSQLGIGASYSHGRHSPPLAPFTTLIGTSPLHWRRSTPVRAIQSHWRHSGSLACFRRVIGAISSLLAAFGVIIQWRHSPPTLAPFTSIGAIHLYWRPSDLIDTIRDLLSLAPFEIYYYLSTPGSPYWRQSESHWRHPPLLAPVRPHWRYSRFIVIGASQLPLARVRPYLRPLAPIGTSQSLISASKVDGGWSNR